MMDGYCIAKIVLGVCESRLGEGLELCTKTAARGEPRAAVSLVAYY